MFNEANIRETPLGDVINYIKSVNWLTVYAYQFRRIHNGLKSCVAPTLLILQIQIVPNGLELCDENLNTYGWNKKSMIIMMKILEYFDMYFWFLLEEITAFIIF